MHCSLLLYGMLCCLDERYPEAGEFFELATTADPTSVIAWTMRGNTRKCTTSYLHKFQSCIANNIITNTEIFVLKCFVVAGSYEIKLVKIMCVTIIC